VSDEAPFPITPEILTWFLDSACVDREKLAQRLGRSVVDILAWENGNWEPSKDDVRKLATILRRPTAAFLLPKKYVEDHADPYSLESIDATYEAANDLIELIRELFCSPT